MAVWSPLITNWAVNLTDSAPRTARIDSIIGHHVAGTSETNALAQFAPGGRVVTPNVFIARKRIWGIVPEDRRAFTSGSAVDDDRALTFEALNESAGPGWSFHPDTLDSIARLQADWSSRYGIRLVHSMPGILEHRNLYEWFRRSYATACAGPSYNINQRIADTVAAMGQKPSTGQNGDIEMRTIYNIDNKNDDTCRATVGEFTFKVERAAVNTRTRKLWGAPVNVTQGEWDAEIAGVNQRRKMVGLEPIKGVANEFYDPAAGDTR